MTNLTTPDFLASSMNMPQSMSSAALLNITRFAATLLTTATTINLTSKTIVPCTSAVNTIVINSWRETLIALTGALVSIITIFGNALVFIAFKRNKKLQTVTNYFILSLAASDLLVGIFSINFYTIYNVKKEWIFGPFVCDAWLSMDYMCCQASVLNLVTICVDRYLSLTRPLTYRVRRTSKRAKVAIICVWVVAFILWVPWIISYQFLQGVRTVPKNDCYIQFLTENAFITLGTALFAFYAPVTIMFILYMKIYKLTKARQKDLALMTNRQTFQESGNINRGFENDQNGWQETLDNKVTQKMRNKLSACVNNRKAAKMIAVIILAYFVTWLPYDVLAVMYPFYASQIPGDLWVFGYFFCYINSTINPFCYAFGNQDFRRTFKEILTCNGPKRKVVKYVLSHQRSSEATLSGTGEFNEELAPSPYGNKRLRDTDRSIGTGT